MRHRLLYFEILFVFQLCLLHFGRLTVGARNSIRIEVDGLAQTTSVQSPLWFGSFSNEIAEARAIFVNKEGRIRPEFLQLLNNLVAIAGEKPRRQPFLLRLGGNSADNTCFERTGDKTRKEDGEEAPCKNFIDGKDFEMYEGLIANAKKQNLSLSLILGLNLGGVHNASAVRPEVELMVKRGLFRRDILHAVEIGNEVDSYIVTHPKANLNWPYQYHKSFRSYLETFRAAGMPARRVQGLALASTLRNSSM